MKFSHLDTLPKVIQRAIIEDDYDRGPMTDISVTELIDSPRIFALKRLYKEYIVEDARNQIHSIIGRAVHKYLQGYARGTDVAEQRLYATIDGIVLSGSMDIQEESDGGITISDYKTWKVDKLKYPHDDLEKQLNAYAYLAEANGKKVTGLKGIIILKDWSMAKAKSGLFYPQSPVEIIQVPLKGVSETDEWIRKRISTFRKYVEQLQSPTDRCTESERWGSDDKLLFKAGKAPIQESDDLEETSTHEVNIQKLQLGATLKVGYDRRCAEYCPVADYCDQYKEILRRRNELKSISENQRSKKKSNIHSEGTEQQP
jgi:hypothetical protein